MSIRVGAMTETYGMGVFIFSCHSKSTVVRHMLENIRYDHIRYLM